MQCVAQYLLNTENPNQYKIKMFDSNPNKRVASEFYLLIYNAAGFQYYCTGVAEEKIVLNPYEIKQRSVLTAEEMLTIETQPLPKIILSR